MFINRKFARLLTVLGLSVALTACNLPSGETSEDSTESEVVSVAGEGEAPTLNPESDRDACLDGNWVMPRGDLDLFVSTLFPVPGLRVTTGELSMSFVDGLFTYAGDYVLHMDLKPGEYMEGRSVFTSGGPYITEANSTITFDLTASEAQVINWSAYVDGQSVSVPGAGPQYTILPPAQAPYRCTATNLEIDVNTPSGMLTMFYQR